MTRRATAAEARFRAAGSSSVPLCRCYALGVSAPEPGPLPQGREFRTALLQVPAAERDAWVDRLLGLDTPLVDGADLPRGCVPYLPCPVDALIAALQHAEVGPSDVLVDIGAGVGRTLVLTQLWTGAHVIGVEVQAELAARARELLTRTAVPHASVLHGDACAVVRGLPIATVFFLYCPFSGERLRRLLADLEDLARTRPIRVCCVSLPDLHEEWLVPISARGHDVRVYRSRWPWRAPSPSAAPITEA